MKKNLFNSLTSGLAVATLVLAGKIQTAPAATVSWVGAGGASATTNWSDSANWSGGGPNGNAVGFSGIGSTNAAGIVTSVVDTMNGGTNHTSSLTYSNLSSIVSPPQYHTTLIPAGITLTNDNGLVVGGFNIASNGWNTTVTIAGGGTLVQNGNVTIGNNSTSTSTSQGTLDLSGLSNFVVNASVGTIQMGLGNRSSGTFNLAQSNSITIGTWNANTLSSSSSAGANLTLGAATNILNIGAYNSALQRNSCTMQFPAGSTGGLRLRGVLGTDASRCTMVLGNRTANGSSGTSTGTLMLTNHPVDIKLGTLTIGQAANVGSANVGIGNIVFDTGTMDVTTTAMGVNAGPATAIGNITVGSNSVTGTGGTLIIGNGGFSMVNASSNGVTDGGLSILGGTVICSNNIFKTMHAGFSGFASITNYGGILNMLSGTIGGLTNSIDFMTCSNSTLVLGAIDYGLTNVTVGNLDTEDGGDSTLLNTISVGLLPGIVSFPAYFHMILYTNGAVPISGAGFDFVATGISGVYTYYVTNYIATVNGNTVGFVDLAVTAGPVAKAITWNGTPTANWNTSDLDWLTGGNPTNFNQGDYVTFDDTASGSTMVNLPATVQPTTMTVNNTANAYTFNGAGRIAGESTLVKQGSNTLLFDNSGNNTFSGAITISAGTVQLGNADANGNLGLGALANNGALVVNRTDTPSLPNAMSGGGGLTNSGAGVLTVNGANSSYTGEVMVAQGTLKLGNNLALGTTNSGTTIASGATLDLNGFSATNIPVTVVGAGVVSAGAIINSSTVSVNPGLTHVILAGNATFGGVGRWDLRLTGAGGTDPSLATLSSGGQPYNLTKTGTNFVSISSVTVDPALGNIDIRGGTLSFENNTTSMGNPANSLTVEAGATLELYSPTNLENKVFVLNGDGTNNTLLEGNGTATVIGPVTLNGSNIWSVTGTSLTVSGPISGSGSLKEIGGNHLILNGNNTYTNTTTVTNGTLALNGISSGLPGLVVVMTNTTLVGTGTNAGAVSIAGRLNPGDVGVAGTLTVGALTLSSGATATFDLNPTTTVGGGANDLLQVNGNLTLNNNTITINLLQGTLAPGTYQLVNYTGTLSGSFNPMVALSTGGTSRYTLTLNTSTPGQINLVVGGSAANVKWDGIADNTWDVGTTPNWLNLGTSAMDNFYQGDTVLLDDTVGVLPDLNLTNAAAPSVITNNSSSTGNNFAISGPGKITGAASIVKEGSSTLLLGTASDFNGTVTVLAGTLQVTNNASLGSTNGATIISSGATLDVIGVPVNNALNLGLEPIIVSGSGVGGEGAIINSGPNPQENATRLITLAGDTTFGGPGQFIIGNGTSAGRWDMRGTGTTLSTTGHPYNLTKVGNNQVSLVGVLVDTNLANIDIQQGMLGFEQSTTSMGNPAANLTVEPGANLELFTGSGTNYYTKQFILNGDGTSTNIDNASGLATLNGTMTLNNGCVIYATSGTTLSNNCVVMGAGSLTLAGSGTMVLTTNETYTGSTTIASGALQLAGTASIANSPSMNLTGVSSRLNVNVRSDQTFTLASGQSLAGIGVVAGNVTAGGNTIIVPGNVNSNVLAITGNLVLNNSSNSFALNTPIGDSTLVVNSNLTLNGVTQLGISSQSQDSVGAIHTIIQYSGKLTGGAANLNVTGLGGFSYSLVDPSTTPGSIQVTVTAVPANFVWRGGVVGSETLWDTIHTNWYDPNLGNTTNFMSGVLAQFDDLSVFTNITLVGALDPLAMDFQDSMSIYTLLGSGRLTGNGGLTLDSLGTLIIANTGSNDFAGDINIMTGGTLQIGNGGTSGNIGVANVINATNSGLSGAVVFDRSDHINIANSINGTSSLTNSGTGVLTLSGNNSLSGVFTVAQGTLQVNNNSALGGTRTQQGTLVVSPGATLDLGGPSFAAQAENLSNEVVVVSGSGVGGNGVIINSSTNSQFNALRNVMVVGDLYVGGPGYFLATNASNPGRWDIRGSITNSALVTSNLQPYSLYKIGSNHVGLVGVTIDSTPGQSLGNIYVEQGKLQIESGTTSLGDVNSNLVVSAGATLQFYQSSFTNNFTKQFVLNGNGSFVTISNENGTTTLNGSMSLNGGCIFGIAGTVITNNCSLSGSGSLIMNGAGRLVLSNTSIAYTGNTTISNGTLQFIGSIPSSPLFDVAGSGAVLDVSGTGGTLAIGSGQIVSGSGTIRGNLAASGTAAVAVGEPGIIGTLTVTNAVTLSGSGSATMKLNRTGAATNDLLKSSSTMALGGTLNVTLLGGTLHAGDTFKLFTASGGLSGTFSATNLPALPTGLGWVTTNLVNGIISVVATVNANPTNITASVSGSVLTLSWPADHTGWRLQSQTNAPANGLNPNASAWSTVTGSTTTNSVVITVDPTQGTVFYRLVYP